MLLDSDGLRLSKVGKNEWKKVTMKNGTKIQQVVN